MRREKRQRFQERDNFKTLMLLSGGVLAIAVLTFVITFSIYNSRLKSNIGTEVIGTEQIASLVSNNYSNNTVYTEEASSEIGKSVNEAKNEVTNEYSNTTVNNQVNNVETSGNTVSKNEEKTSTNVKNTTNNVTPKKEEEKVEEKPKDPTFVMPVEGEISTKYAKDSLIFSETLQEWITHLGIDIKAAKTTVVKAATDGKVESIKNDPRYGLTITIVHDNGFKSVYSNLLTSEFVEEGEEVKSGQSIGTVGNTAAFEVADEPHLHFELIKDDERIDPTAYLK